LRLYRGGFPANRIVEVACIIDPTTAGKEAAQTATT
jgi:hypothetical protein